MTDPKEKLYDRLLKIWDHPNFSKLFLTAKRQPHLVKKGTIIFNEGDPLERIYYIHEGFVKLFRLSKEGRETTIYLFGPGNILGVRALTSEDECARHFAQALTDLRISTIARKEYLNVLSEHPEYLVDLLHVFIGRLNYTERKLEGFIITDAVARIAYFLADCVNRFCKVENNQTQIPLPLTHQKIAEFVGSVRETVSLAIKKLEKQGVLKDQRGVIKILDNNKLQNYASIY